jgi:lipopolysaccharide/colanic/teichoic acid biosynthesis glycosyltransferase
VLKRIALFICDLLVIGFAALGAYLVRENFEASVEDILALLPYIVTTLLIGASSLSLFRLHRGMWRLSSLSDYLRICAVSVFIVALTMAVGFLGNRLQNVARALPVIQIMLTALGLVGLRVGARLFFAWSNGTTGEASARPDFARGTRTVILVGLNRVTMLYVRSVEDLGSSVRIAGIVTDIAGTQGRAFGQYPILGRPSDLGRIVSDLAVHGVFVTHACIMVPRRDLRVDDFGELSAAAESHSIEIEFFVDKLTGVSLEAADEDAKSGLAVAPSSQARTNEQFWRYAHRPYWKVKRALDVVASAALIVGFAPVFVLVGLAVAIDIGLPVIFWQERPGARGRPFRIYKFRTMRHVFDRDGRRLPDEARVSAVGRTLRLCRLDELPQLFNVLVGEMSFVGPRPLLPIDQFPGLDARLAVAPGITGWAQVNGGREISSADKAALDLWYLQNASLRIDVEIALATLRTVFKGEVTNHEAIERAWLALRMRRPGPTVAARAMRSPARLEPDLPRLRAVK